MNAEHEIDKELGELFEIDSNNQLSALIDKLYSIGEQFCNIEPEVINKDKNQKCRLLLQNGDKAWLVEVENEWPLVGKMLNGDMYIKLDLAQCKTKTVKLSRGGK